MALSTKQKSDVLMKHYLGVGSTRDNREFFEEAIKSSFVVRPDQLWTYSDRIPDGTEATGGMDNIEYIVNMGLNGNDPIFYHYISEDQDKVPLVKRYIDLPLTMIDKGTDNAFLIADENGNQIKDIIPFNYYEEYYNYVLKTAEGVRIPFGVGDWTIDTYSGIVTFYGELPDGVDHNNPPKLSFYQYIGGNGFRQDTYGYDGAILPLDNIEIPAGSCVVSNGSEGRTLFQHIVDKANEIQDDFVDIFGWDGADKNEGIALSFEKIIPLTYTSNQDAVKGYDQASNSEIGTLLTNKTVSDIGTDNYEIVFASQKLSPLDTYKISISDGVAIGAVNPQTWDEQDPVNITGNEWNLYKVWLTDNAFVVLKVNNLVNEDFTFNVSTKDNVVTALLLYWSDQDKQYQPFLPKEDILGNFGFPVVTINGRLPPSVQLGTAALATFSDVITPDYYGPRSFAVVIAKEDGTDVKSADYIVKNKEDWYLNDILDQIETRYGSDLKGTIFLRAGYYLLTEDLDLSRFSNAIIEGEFFSTTIDFQGHKLISDTKLGNISEINHIKLANVESVEIKGSGITLMSDLFLGKAPIEINTKITSATLFRNLSAGDLTIKGEQDAEVENVDVRACHFANVKIYKNKTYLRDCVVNELSVDIKDTEDNTLVLRGNVINTLATKYADLFIDGNMIFRYKGIAGSAANQIPVGTAEDHTVMNTNKDVMTTTGRFPIFNKDDFLHMKYAEFASPFNYNKKENIIELLYDTEVLKIVDGKLTTVIKSDRIAMSEVVFDRHENSGLDPVYYNNSNNLNDVFKHIYMWKADLDDNGKIPLQELPDSVAYGGLLYVGTWSFEQNSGLYPTFNNAAYRQNISKDDVVDQLQKGWFFIVQEALDRSDTDADNDTPVTEQTARDGTVFTAGDWVIYVGDGSDDVENANGSWQKIDRAYSDPTYSPLPYYAKVPEVENLDWYWKKNRNGGALDLSGDTIIEAFKKVNDELRKLQPKRPQAIRDVTLELDEEYPTVSYRNFRNGVLGQIQTKLDTSKVEKYKILNKPTPDGVRTYKELIFFGDEAKLTVTVDDVDYEFKVGVDYPAQEQGPVYVSKATESMLYADHGEGYWQGVYIVVNNDNLKDGTHTVHAAMDDVKVIYDDRTDTYQFQNEYSGVTNTVQYSTYEPYFPSNLQTVKDSYVGIAEMPIFDLATANMCSGIRKIDLHNFKKIQGIELWLADIYKDWNVPTDKLVEVKVLLNDDPEKVFCETVIADENVVLEENPKNTLYQHLHLENFEIPVTYENKDDILPYDTTLDFYITVYDLYNQPHEIKFYTYTGLRFDPTEESERCKPGNPNEDSSFKDFKDSFGGLWYSSSTCVTDLVKVGELVDGKTVGVYQQPSEIYWVGPNTAAPFNPAAWTGVQYGDDFYGMACFNIGHIEDATGFVFRIDCLEKDLAKYTFDKLSGSTNEVIIQVCLVDNSKLDHSEAKVTAFLDADNPYDGFTPVAEKVFETPVMYAGNSTATEKRVTFGRHKILSGDVYVRIGLKKDSGLRFTGITLVEEI